MIVRLLAVSLLLLASPALAQEPSPAMPGMADSGPGADRAMMGAMHTMSQAMDRVPTTGDADHDFAAMMIPHHQGAIDMAKAELKYGKDPAMRSLARAVVAAQQTEIARMRRWLAQKPTR